jgi:hypothetical protein
MSYPSTVSPSDRTQLPAAPRRPRAWRWIVVLAVVLVLHWIAAQWVERNREIFTSGNTSHVPVQITLLKPERIERKPASAAPRPAAAPVHKAAASKPREHVLTATRPRRRRTRLRQRPKRRHRQLTQQAPRPRQAVRAAHTLRPPKRLRA